MNGRMMRKLNSMKNMGYRDVKLHRIECRYKKGKSFITREMEVVSVCNTAQEMNETSRLITELKAEVFGIKSVGYKTPNNFWVTKVLESRPISKSFYYTDSNYNDNDIKGK